MRTMVVYFILAVSITLASVLAALFFDRGDKATSQAAPGDNHVAGGLIPAAD
jgi:hypothetical protein